MDMDKMDNNNTNTKKNTSSNVNNIKKGFEHVRELYENLTYYDQYGSSIFFFIILTIIVFIIVSYCYVIAHIQPIKDDWVNQRCKPYVIPFAGLINKPKGETITDFTQENFDFCSQTILKNISGFALEPITFVTSFLSSTADFIKEAINDVRTMFDKIRTFFQTITQEIMQRILNMVITLQKIVISIRDMMSKIQGVMTTSLYTLLGSYYSLQALFGAIAEFIIIILISMAAMIIVLFIGIFTIPEAIALSGIFTAIAIPMAIILVFMFEFLHVKPDLQIPELKCFDKNTMIEMEDKSKINISKIKIGDKLIGGNIVTGKIKVESKGSKMYHLNNIIVSDTHIVNYNNKWIRICDHPEAIYIHDYNEPILYCLNTSFKNIFINDTLFTDWDEIYNKSKIFNEVNKYPYFFTNHSFIHKLFDSGFSENTLIELSDGSFKKIKDIRIGEKLEDEIIVYGIVEIDGQNLKEQSIYNINQINIIGTNLFPLIDASIIKQTQVEYTCKQKKMYHLLTNKHIFCVNKMYFHDYNYSIESILHN
jgi:hypothetical protein